MMSHTGVLRAGSFSIRTNLRILAFIAALLVALAVLVCLGLTLGSRPLAAGTVTRWLLGGAVDPTDRLILSALRAPRICLAVVSGAMLALAGALTQHITRNGLADPSLIGVRSGAALCIVSLVIFWPAAALAWRPVAGLAGGLAAGGILAVLARHTSPVKLVMIGFGLSWSLSSALVILMSSASIDSVQRAMVWLAGSLTDANWPSVRLALVPGLGATLIIFSLARHLELEDLGEMSARGLGSRHREVRVACLIAAVVLVATSVSVVGGLGFVGLIAPHLARFAPKQGLAAHFVLSMILGAILVLAADLIAATAFAPILLPVGVPLAVLGSPLLVLLLWLRRNRL